MPFDEALDAYFDDDLDITDSDEVIDLLEDAAHMNLECPLRKGSTVHLKSVGNLLMTGDLHDHRQNYRRILKLAKLDESPDNHVILHEVIHGKNIIDDRDMSIEMLVRVFMTHLLVIALALVLCREALWMMGKGIEMTSTALGLRMIWVFSVLPLSFLLIVSVGVEHLLAFTSHGHDSDK